MKTGVRKNKWKLVLEKINENWCSKKIERWTKDVDRSEKKNELNKTIWNHSNDFNRLWTVFYLFNWTNSFSERFKKKYCFSLNERYFFLR